MVDVIRPAASGITPGVWTKIDDANAWAANFWRDTGETGTSLVIWTDDLQYFPGHGVGGGLFIFARRGGAWICQYDIDDDVWSRANAYAVSGTQHSYSTYNAADTTRSELYANRRRCDDLSAPGTWTDPVPDPPRITSGQTPYVYHQSRDELCRIAAGELMVWPRGAGSWTIVQTGCVVDGYHTLGRYNSTRQEVLFAGGNGDSSSGIRDIVLYQSDGTVVQRENVLPHDIKHGGDKQGTITVDPVSGLYLIWFYASDEIWSYDASADEMALVHETSPFLANETTVLATYAPDIGVSIWVDQGDATSQGTGGGMWIYQLDADPADPPPTPPPDPVDTGERYTWPQLTGTAGERAAGVQPVSSAQDLAATGAMSWAASASLTAAGTLAATGASAWTATADVSAAGILTAAGTIGWTATADLTGILQDLAATGTIIWGSSATPSATGALVATGPLAWSGTAALTAPGALVATGALDWTAAASLTATGTMDATGAIVWSAAVDPSATGSLSAAGALAWSAAASLTSLADLSATGAIDWTGAASLTAIGALAATGTITWASSADLLATGTLGATGAIVWTPSASLTAAGELSATGAIAWTGSADLQSPTENDITATGDLAFAGAASMTATGALVAAGVLNFGVAADLSAAGTLAAGGNLAWSGSADLTTPQELIARGDIFITATALLSATGTLSASAGMTWTGSAVLADANAGPGIYPQLIMRRSTRLTMRRSTRLTMRRSTRLTMRR